MRRIVKTGICRIIGIVLAIGVAMPALRAFGQTAGPQTQSSLREWLNPVELVQGLRNQAEHVQPSAEQRARLAAIFAGAQREARSLEAQVHDLPPLQKVQRVMPFMRGLRQELGTVLTPQQLSQLRQAPATQPATNRPPPGPPGQGPAAAFIERFRAALGQLNLSADQKAQVTDVFTQMRGQAEQIRRSRLAGANVADQMRTLITDTRDKIIQILDPDQRRQLRDILQSERGAATQPAALAPQAPQSLFASRFSSAAPAARVDAPATAPDSEKTAVETPLLDSFASAAPAQASTTATSPALAATALKVGAIGSPAPGFRLLTPGQVAIQLANLKGRVVVLEFGSATCPSFRDHAAAMDQLQQKYTSRAYFLTIYTREAHPAGGWEVARNQDDGVSVPDSTSLTARMALAEKTRAALNMNIPIVVDTMDNATTTAYGGFPNATVVINGQGIISGRQQWNDPFGLDHLIQNAIGDTTAQ